MISLLVAGICALPQQGRAQAAAVAAPPATATTAPAAEAAKPKEAEKSEQDEADVYRHAPVVQKMAKMLHLPVETVAKSSEFINLAIIVLALGIPLGRILPKIIRKRSQTVLHNIEEARKVTADANTRLSAVEAKLASLDGEIAKFRAEVERESLDDEKRIKATLEEESARIVVQAEQEIGVAAAQARRGLRNFAAELAVEQAAKQMVLSPETDRALIAEFVGDAAKGGQN